MASGTVDDLTEVKGRLQHVRKETDRISKLGLEYLNQAVSYRTPRYSIKNTYSVYVKLEVGIPLPLRAIVGSTVNELRATLDELACRLAVRNGRTMNGVYFPASRNEELFNERGMEKIRKLSPEDKEKIRKLAPYEGGGKTKIHLLHAADLKRKHQPLSVYTADYSRVSLGGFQLGKGSQIVRCYSDSVYIEHATFLPNLNLGHQASDAESLVATGIPVQLPLNIDLRLAYETPDAIKGMEVIESLQDWSDDVEYVISLFD